MLRLFPSTLRYDHTEPSAHAPAAAARPPADPDEQRTLRRLAASRRAPADSILRARIVVRAGTASEPPGRRRLGYRPEPVRQSLTASTAAVSTALVTDPGPVGRAGSTGPSVANVRLVPRPRPVGWSDGRRDPRSVNERAPGVWTLDALVQAAHELGIAIERSQVRRILLKEGGALAAPRSSTPSRDPEFVRKGPGPSTSILTRRPG